MGVNVFNSENQGNVGALVFLRYRDKTVRHLQIARTLRSITQGIAVVDLTLYLKQLHWSGTAIGGVMSGAGLVGAALILIIGVMSDRYGRKQFLIVYEIITSLAALTMVFTTNATALVIAIVVTGFGRGQNGAAGPFTPAEQAWMAARVPQSERGSVFSTNTALGFFGMAIGALLAGAPSLWHKYLPGALAYRPLFMMMFVISTSCLVVIATAPVGDLLSANTNHPSAGVFAESTSHTSSATWERSSERSIRRRENLDMAKLAGVNALNGLAIGFMGPMMSYWFALKFGVTSSQIGLTLALSFLLTSASSLITGSLATRYGMVKSVVWLQLLGITMILLLPLAPSFWLASAIYVARSAFSRGTQGARSALSTSLTRDKRRGFSVSMNSLAMRLPSSVGPTLSGAMLDVGVLSIPFYIAGGLQLASTLLYGRMFRSFDRPKGGNP